MAEPDFSSGFLDIQLPDTIVGPDTSSAGDGTPEEPTNLHDNPPRNFSNTVGKETLNDILINSGLVDKTYEEAIAKSQALQSNLDEIQVERIAKLKAAAIDAGAIAISEENNKNKAAQDTQSFGNAAGASSDPMNISGIMLQLGDELKKSIQDQNKSYDAIKYKIASGKKVPGITPINKLDQVFGANTKEADLFKLQVQHTKDLQSQIEAINSTVQSTAKTQIDLNGVVSASVIQAKARVAGAIATDKANEVAAHTALYDMQEIREIAQMSGEQLGRHLQIYNAGALAEQRAAQRIQLSEMNRLRLEAAEAKQLNAQAEQQLVEDAQFGLRAKGIGGATALPAKQIAALINSPNRGILGQRLAEAVEVGMQARAFPSESVIISDSPARTVDMINSDSLRLKPEQRQVQQVLIDANSAAREGRLLDSATPDTAIPEGRDGHVNVKDKTSVGNATNRNTLTLLSAAHKQIKYNDSSNPYQAPAFVGKKGEVGLAAVRGIDNDPFFQKVLKTQVDNGMTEVDPQRLLALGVKAISQGKADFKEVALGITKIGQVSVGLNNAVKNYKAFGLPEQKAYNSPITSTRLYSSIARGLVSPLSIPNYVKNPISVKIVNFADYVEVSNALSAELVAEGLNKRIAENEKENK